MAGWIKMSDTLGDIARSVRAQARHDDPRNLRRHGRMRAESVACSHGQVLDLSAGGVRLLSKKALAGDHAIRLEADNESITLMAAVVWGQKLGFRKFEIGMEFHELPDHARAIIRRMAAR